MFPTTKFALYPRNRSLYIDKLKNPLVKKEEKRGMFFKEKKNPKSTLLKSPVATLALRVKKLNILLPRSQCDI